MNARKGTSDDDYGVWIGADDVSAIWFLDLADVPAAAAAGLVGIEVHKNGAKDGNQFGYSTAARSESAPGGYYTDDIHTSLAKLCADYKLPLDLVVDRLAVALLRFAQRAGGAA